MNANLFEYALAYANNGWSVFPADAEVKKGILYAAHPLTPDRKWGQTKDPVQINEIADFFRSARRIGIATGEKSGLFVFECDTPEGHDVDGFASLAALEAFHGKLPDTLQAESPSGSKHFYFRWPGFRVTSSTGKLDPKTGKLARGAIALGIDVKGDEGMVIAPPSVNLDGRSYRWINDYPIVDAPPWLIDRLRKHSRANRDRYPKGSLTTIAAPLGLRPKEGTQAATVLANECAKLAEMEPGDGRSLGLTMAAKAIGRFVAIGEIAEDVARHDLMKAAAECGILEKKGDAQCLSKIRNGLGYGAEYPAQTAQQMFGSVAAIASVNPIPMTGRGEAQAQAWASVISAVPVVTRNASHPEVPPEISHPLRDAINAAIPGIIVSWDTEALAIVTAVHPETANKIAALIPTVDKATVAARASGIIEEVENDLKPADYVRDHKGEIQNDNIDNVAFFLSQLATEIRWNSWTEAMEIRGWKWSEWTFVNDHVVTLLRGRASQTGTRFRVGKDFLWDSLLALSLRTKVDPVLDTLKRFEQSWDGVPRLDTWLHNACGVPNDEYHQAVSRNVIGGMVKRARRPGCKHDEVLLFIGEQGTNKSTVPSVIALQEDWFTDEIELGDPSKELVLSLAGKLVVEIGEMGRKTVAGNNTVKSMLVRRIDRGRTAYARTVTARPRRNIFVATTNDPEPLSDLTGNRRWLPVRIGSEINVDWLSTNIAMIVGEAAARETKGETFRISKHLWGTAAEHQEAATETPEYQNILREWLAPRGLPVFMTIADLSHIAREAAGGRVVKSSEYNRVVERLGFRRQTKRVDGRPMDVWLRGDGKDAYRVTAASLRALPRGVNLSMSMDTSATRVSPSLPTLTNSIPPPPY